MFQWSMSFEHEERSISELMAKTIQRYGLAEGEIDFEMYNPWQEHVEELDALERALSEENTSDKLEIAKLSGSEKAAQAQLLLVRQEKARNIVKEFSQPLLSSADPLKKHAIMFHDLKTERAREFVEDLRRELGDDFYHTPASDGEISSLVVSSDELTDIYRALKSALETMPDKSLLRR